MGPRKQSTTLRVTIACILSLLLALSGLSPQALAEALDEASTFDPIALSAKQRHAATTDMENEQEGVVAQGTDGNATETTDGPSLREDADPESSDTVEENTPQEWTIELQANGGLLAEDMSEEEAILQATEDTDTVDVPDVFVREGFVLKGWSTQADPDAWQEAFEKERALDPAMEEPDDAPLWVPAMAHLYNLTYSFVVLDDGTIHQVSDVTAARGHDSEGREVQTCDLRERVQDGKLVLYAQWKEVPEDEDPQPEDEGEQTSTDDTTEDDQEADAIESSDDASDTDSDETEDEPEETHSDDATETDTDEEEESNGTDSLQQLDHDQYQQVTDNEDEDTDVPSSDTDTETVDDEDEAVEPETTETQQEESVESDSPITSESELSEPDSPTTPTSDANENSPSDVSGDELPKSAEPVADVPTGSKALLSDPDIVIDSANGDEEATAILDAAEKDLHIKSVLSNPRQTTSTETGGLLTQGTTLKTQADLPMMKDGTYINDFSLVWNTIDTVDDKRPAHLDLTPTDDALLNMQARLQFALSGEKNYPAGTIQFTIPAQVIKDRDEHYIGSMTIGVPEEPETSQSFAYRLVTPTTGDPYFVITNTRALDSATTGVIQFSIRGITPHVVHSGQESPDLQAHMSLTTARGNQMEVDSGVLNATIHTEEHIQNAYKNGGKIIDPDDAPDAIRNALDSLSNSTTKDDYVLVRWNTYSNVEGNQTFTFTMQDTLGAVKKDGTVIDAPGSVVVGTTDSASNTLGTTYTKDVLTNAYLESDESRYENVWTAYPKSLFEDDHEYELNNDVTWTVTPQDDPETATHKDASAKIIYRNPKPISFTADVGHYAIEKETLEPHRYPTSTNTSLTDLHGIGTGPKAVAPKDTTINFTVTAYGEIMEQTMAEGTNLKAAQADTDNPVIDPATDDRFHQRYVTMEVNDDAIYLNGNYGQELGSDDYYISKVTLHDPYVYAYTHEDNDETKEWGYYRNRDFAPLPTMELWGLSETTGATVDTWTKYATVTYGTNNARTVTTTNGANKTGLAIELPENAGITRVKVVSSAKDVDALRIEYNPSMTLRHDGPRVKALVDQLFATSDNPSTLLRNDVTLAVYHGNPLATLSGHEPDVDISHAKLNDIESGKVFAIDSPNPQSVNFDRTRAMDTDRYGKTMWHYASLAYMRGAVPRIGVTSRKTLKYDQNPVATGGDLDAANMRAYLHYTTTVHEQSNILTREAYDQYVADGAIQAETSGTWYDLLPPGVTPILSSIKLRDADSVIDTYTVENYRGTGRVLLVVKADLVPQPAYNDIVEGAVAGEGYWTQGYYDEPRLSFDAVYSYADYSYTNKIDHNKEDELINVVAFESDNEELGNLEGMMGEYDDATGGISATKAYRNKETEAAVRPTPDVANMAQAMSDLDSTLSNKKPTFVYARAKNNISFDRSSINSITKQVASDAEGVFRSGTSDANLRPNHTNQVNVFEGHGYTYRIEVSRSSGETSNIVLYDALENYQLNYANEDFDIGDQRWKGTLTRVDTSQIEAMGVAPVVYYSTTIDSFEDSGSVSEDDKAGHVNLSYVKNTLDKSPSAWVKADEYTGNLSNVKAVAIDCSKAAGTAGETFILPEGTSLIAYIHMQAPTEVKSGSESNLFNKIHPANDENEPNNNAHAFNNVYIYSEVKDKDTSASPEFYHPDYVKVGILPYAITINKVWDDADNNDGKRPDTVTVRLLANGVAATDEYGNAVEPIVLGKSHAHDVGYTNDGWARTIEDIPYVDANNKPIRYTLSEDAITEELDDHSLVKLYSPSYLRTDDAHLQITNKRVPETVDLVVKKTWNDEGDSAGKRPSTIRLRLYADGVYMDTKNVHAATDGTWSYTFSDLPAYKKGEKVVYNVVEEPVEFYAADYETLDAGYGSTVAADGTVQGSVNITNTYATTGLLSITKTSENVVSQNARNADFTFRVELFGTEKDEGQNPLPLGETFSYYKLDSNGQRIAGSEGTIRTGGTVTIKAGQRAIIEGLPIGSTYKVTEQKAPGFTQIASKDTTGTIHAGVTPNHAAQASFTNTYDSSGSFQLKATKRLQGQKLGLYAFRFQAYQVFNEGAENEYEQVVRSASNGAGTEVDANGVSTGDITFGRTYVSLEDLGPDGALTLLYRIREVKVDRAGYTYATNVEQVRVTLTDNGDGTIVATQTPVKIENGTSHIKPLGDNAEITTESFHSDGTATFTNSYNATGTLELKAWKALKGATMQQGQFTFLLTAVTEGAPMATGKDNATGNATYDSTYNATGHSMTGTNDDTGIVNFPTILLTGADGGKSYIYKVSEVAGNAAGVNYSDEVYYYRVDVTDDGAGNITSTSTVVKPKKNAVASDVTSGNPEAFEASDAQPIITNTLKPGNLTITKRLTEGSAYNNEEFEFQVVLNGPSIDENSNFGYTVSNPATLSILPTVRSLAHATIDALGDAWDMLVNLVCPREAYAATTVKTGTWDTCTWTLDSDGKLTIEPTNGANGTFAAHSSGDMWPWYDWTADEIASIKTVTFKGTILATDLMYLFDYEKLHDYSAENKRFSNLESIDFSGLDVSQLTSMHSMLRGCSHLTSLTGIGDWNLAQCEDMEHAFFQCEKLSNASLSVMGSWQTSNKLNSIHGIFNGCKQLESLDLSGWTVSGVTNMESVFKNCENLTSISLANWDTGNVVILEELFRGCSHLTSLDLSGWNTGKVTSLASTFQDCSSLKTLDLSGWDVAKVTSLNATFARCSSLETLDLTGWTTPSLTNLGLTFYECPKIASLDVSGFDVSKVTSMDSTFYNCAALTELDLSNWHTSDFLTYMAMMFFNCTGLTTLDLSGFNTSHVTAMNELFRNCTNMETLDLTSFNTFQATDMHGMFWNCPKLSSLDVSTFNTSKNSKFDNMFDTCTKLEKLDLSGFDMSSSTTNAACMFVNDAALKEIVLPAGFKFYSGGTTDGNQLPDPPSGSSQYTGNWIDSTNSNATGISSADLASTWQGATMTGTYVWELNDNVYAIKYNANGGIGAVPNQPLALDAAKTPLSANTFTRPGHAFVSWNTKADGSGISLDDQAEVTATSFTTDGSPVPAKSTVNLYAQWRSLDSVATKGNYTMTVKIKANRMATIEDIPAGTTYQVFEKTPAGWQLMEQSKTAGNIEPEGTKNAIFTNNYAPTTATAQLYATKTLDGTSAEADAFEFTLTGVNSTVGTNTTVGAPMPANATGNTLNVSNASAGMVYFGAITYDKAGIYVYSITEKPGTDKTIVYDISEWTAIVKVENKGTEADPVFETTVTYSDGTSAATTSIPTFANTTKPGELTVEKKGINITPANEDAEFNFTVQLQNSGQAVDNASYYIENADGTPMSTQSEDDTNPLSMLSRFLENTGDSLIDLFIPRNAYAAASESGTFGVNGSCTWEWDATTKTITVRPTNPEVASDTGNSICVRERILPWDGYKSVMEYFVVDGTNAKVEMTDDSTFSDVFRDCTSLKEVDLSALDLSNYWRLNSHTGSYPAWARMFQDCTSLERVEMPRLTGSVGVNPEYMFSGCTSLKNVVFSEPKEGYDSSFDITGVKECCMFKGCTSLETIDLSNVNLVGTMNLARMFEDCKILKDVNLSVKGSSNIESTKSMFQNCDSLIKVDISILNNAMSLTDISYMFMGCDNLAAVDMSGLGSLPNLENMEWMFAECPKITNLDFSSLNATKVKYLRSLVRQCVNLESLNLSGISTTNLESMVNMFLDTNKLSKIVLGDKWTKSSANAYLPNVTPNDIYTGKWVKIEDVAAGINDKPLTSNELMSRSNSNVTDYAGTWVWQLKTEQSYTVILNPLGGYYDSKGNALPGSLTAAVGSDVTLPIPQTYVSNGKRMRFVAWRTGYANGTYSGENSFAGGAIVNNGTFGLNTGGYVTLYAEWAPDTTVNGTKKIWLQNTDLSDRYTLARSTDFEFPDDGIVPDTLDGFIYNPIPFSYTGGAYEYDSETSTYTITPTEGAELNFYYNRTYKIKFDNNNPDATGTMDAQTMIGNVAQKLSANAFTCEGKSFLGWNTKRDGSGTSYIDQQQVKNLGDITLYAQWASGKSQNSSTGTYSFKLKAGQKVHFINVPAGTTYTVVETDIPNGWTQTGTNGHTTGTIQAAYTSEAKITNTYNATGVVSLRARKTMQSGTLTEGQFSFELLDSKEHVLQTVTNQAPANGTATADILFDALEYDLSDLMDNGTYTGSKTYTYKIREVVPQNADDGVIYGAVGQTEQEVTVEVEDAGKGKLTVTPSNITTTGTDTVVTVNTVFTNDYKPGNLEVSKSTTGTNEASKDAAFSFTVNLKDAQGNPVDDRYGYDLVRIDQNGTETKDTNRVTFSAGQATIGNVRGGESFRIEGIAQGTTYEVKETAIPNGFTPSGVEGDEGTIGAGQTSFASFTNSYQAEGSVRLATRKVLEEGNIADYTFTFQLFNKDNHLIDTETNDKAGNVTFKAIGFSAQDAGTAEHPKKYSYKITEVDDKQDYIIYDQTYLNGLAVAVSVWDDGLGTIHADAFYGNEDERQTTAPDCTNRLRNAIVLPATGGNGIAVPIAVSVIVATGEAARRMRRRRREE